MNFLFLILIAISLCSLKCTSGKNKETPIEESGPETTADMVTYYGLKVVRELPHDSTAFTQGLIYKDGFIYESTGLRGQSTLRKVELETGNVVKVFTLNSAYFGEGLVFWEDSFIQLTWQAQKAFSYSETESGFALNDNGFSYAREGWGITENGVDLIMSDGSSRLYFLDPASKEDKKALEVTLNGQSVDDLNELEYVQGLVFANIWQKDQIVMIDPETGLVNGVIEVDVRELLGSKYDAMDPRSDVLNGIAYDSQNAKLYITGKNWPSLFEVTLETISQPSLKY